MEVLITEDFFKIEAVSPKRVARWYISKPNIPIWENFGGFWNGKGSVVIWNILRPFGTFYGHLVI
jgi:hypothetical protein